MSRFGHSGAATSPAKVTAHGDAPSTTLATLCAFFWLWKALLLLVALGTPAPGYDTSTQILLDRYSSASTTWLSSLTASLVIKLTRWDAIYFTSISDRGVVFEQEWAFNSAFPKLTAFIAQVFPRTLHHRTLISHALAGILVSHVSHFLAVLLLYWLTAKCLPNTSRQIAFITACLHAVSPAGLFLSAPYGESVFALANLSGMLAYLVACQSSNTTRYVCSIIGAGFMFGLAATLRSNGLLSGTILAWDLLTYMPKLPTILRNKDLASVIRLGALFVAGSILALFYAVPQFTAYLHYCTAGNDRPWCHHWLPSIYTWVQSHYWRVGLWHYWTPSNLPLFALAAPMLAIMLATGWAVMISRGSSTRTQGMQNMMSTADPMARLALPQIILALLALTSFHVQIINRISSGYPVWYIVLANAVSQVTSSKQASELLSQGPIFAFLAQNSKSLVRLMIVYAIVQGGLYAAFMPPA